MIKRLIIGVLLFIVILIGMLLAVNLINPSEKIPKQEKLSEKAPDFDQRQWWESTTVYQIYPRSYQDSDGDGIGDIEGIISRLDYIKELGFETIWFSPFFKSPQKDFGYDVSDYILPDPDYGDTLLVDSLIHEIHRRDMKVVFDLVLNHTSDEHPWFKESRQSKNNPKSDWYVWKNGNGDDPPNNWHSALGMNGWHFDSIRNQWYFSSFLEFQPDLNWHNPEVKQAMFDVVRYWLDKGVDGFRLDIFNYIYEDPAFKNNPFTLRYLPTKDFSKMFWQHKIYNMNYSENFELARELRSILDQYTPSRFMVGEVFGDQKTLKNYLGENNDGLNLIFLFEISDFEWNADFFREKIEKFEAFYPFPYQPTYVFSNHDRPRSISRLSNDLHKAGTLSLIQFTLRGVPFVYQGEEIGMLDGNIPLEDALDPIPSAFSWLPDIFQGMIPNRDNVRTPMQWNGEKNAGFTLQTAKPWLPVLDNSDTINVEAQTEDPESLLNLNKELLAIRDSYSSLKWGSLKVKDEYENSNIFAYERTYKDEKISVYVNFTDSEIELDIDGNLIFTNGGTKVKDGKMILFGNSGVIFKE